MKGVISKTWKFDSRLGPLAFHLVSCFRSVCLIRSSRKKAEAIVQNPICCMRGVIFSRQDSLVRNGYVDSVFVVK